MLTKKMFRFVVTLSILALASSDQAQAQFFSYGSSGVGFGGQRSGGWGGYSGGYGYGGSYGGGYGGGYGSGYGANNSYFGGGYMPFYGVMAPGMREYAGPIYYPGWVVSGNSIDTASAIMRGTIQPAVGVPANSPLLLVGTGNTEVFAESRAEMVMSLPSAGAQVWVEGALTSQSGLSRRFTTPTLLGGRQYVYDVRARWTDAEGQVRTAQRSVTFRPGDVISVDFTR